MGDRANVVFNTKGVMADAKLKDAIEGQIVLYSHWGGYDLASDLGKALHAASPRWSDHGYATRIIVSQIVGNDWKSETGYGLYVGELGDNERNILVVDFVKRNVVVFTKHGEQLRALPFMDFIKLDDASSKEFHGIETGPY